MPIVVDPVLAPIPANTTGRSVFPTPDSQLIYQTDGGGLPLKSKAGSTVTIYLDAGATTVADILNLDASVVAGAVLTVDQYSLIPQFYGPVAAVTLYAKSNPSGPIVAVYANVTQSNLAAETAARIAADLLIRSDSVAGFVPKANPQMTGKLAHQQLSGTTATDIYTALVQRNTQYSGGAAGFANNTLRVVSDIGAGATAYEWGILSQLSNRVPAAAGQNTALYSVGIRTVSPCGPTLGGVIEIRDTSTLPDPTTTSVALEVDVMANGSDATNNRIGIDLVVGNSSTGSAAKCFAYAAIRIGQNSPTVGYWSNGLLIYGDNGSGINISGTTTRGMLVTGASSNSVIDIQGAQSIGLRLDGGTFSLAAIRMGRGQKFSYETTNAFTTYLDNAVDIIQFEASGTIKVGLSIATPALLLANTQVVGIRNTGWAAFTGISNKIAIYDPTSVTLVQLAQRVSSIQAALTTHGLLGT